ncbi:ATP11-domain-containing protein, partial [Rhodotorula sp. JG-1b]
QPLNDIMDLSKASDLTTQALSQLWTAYHQSKGFLSAAVPLETYLRMLNSARKYPLFVLPLARVAELPEGQEAESATEMHLLEWSLLPQPSATEPVPPPSTVLFTPLAEYKARQEFSQPYLILTHYTDLAASHNVVLMRGEISANVALNSTDAQMLAIRMQMFYNDTGKGGDLERQRRELLRSFHETPEQFDVDALIKAGTISDL